MDASIIIDLIGLLIVGTVLISKCGKKTTLIYEHTKEHFLFSLMLTVSILIVLDLFGLLFNGIAFREIRVVLYLVDTLYWLTSSVFCYEWFRFADFWNYEREDRLVSWKLLYSVPMYAEFALVLINLGTGWLFTLDEMNKYKEGSERLLMLIPIYLYVIYPLLLTVYRYFTSQTEREKRKSMVLLLFMFLPVCSLALDIFSDGYSWIWTFVAISLLMIHLYNEQQQINDSRLRVARSEAALAQGNISVMLSQIQPNFLYQSLHVIERLLDEDVREAQRAVSDFSKYLRGNLDSLNRNGPVSFDTELKHTELYLSLQKLNFNGALEVIYHIDYTGFLIPALTLQPLVENAVKYSIGKVGKGTVLISSRELRDCIEVTVADDGAGYDMNTTQKDGRTGIGIDSVRNRLSRIRNATLSIEKNGEYGMLAIIRIPKGIAK